MDAKTKEVVCLFTNQKSNEIGTTDSARELRPNQVQLMACQ